MIFFFFFFFPPTDRDTCLCFPRGRSPIWVPYLFGHKIGFRLLHRQLCHESVGTLPGKGIGSQLLRTGAIAKAVPQRLPSILPSKCTPPDF